MNRSGHAVSISTRDGRQGIAHGFAAVLGKAGGEIQHRQLHCSRRIKGRADKVVVLLSLRVDAAAAAGE